MVVRLDGPVRGEAAVRAAVAQRSGGVCEIAIAGICRGRNENISHRKARSQGGLWSTANCMAACGSGTTGCHGWVESHPTEARQLGLRLTSRQSPLAVPALMRTAQWPLARYYLNDDGTLTCA